MFNIEEKIRKWYENQKIIPVVKTENKQNNDNNESSITVTSKTTTKKSSNLDRETLKKNLENYEKEMKRLKEEYLYDLEEYKDGEYSDKSIEKKANELANETYKEDYDKENLKNGINLERIDVKRQEIETNATKNLDKIESEYENLTKDTTDKAIKNGISRSTIYEGEVEKQKKDKNQDIVNSLDKTELAIKDNLLDLEYEDKRHENTISELDAKKKNAVDKYVEELKEERQFLIDTGKIPNISNYDPNKITPEMRELRKDIISKTLEYYYSMDKETAKSEYEKDEDLKKLLGDLEPSIRYYIMGSSGIM